MTLSRLPQPGGISFDETGNHDGPAASGMMEKSVLLESGGVWQTGTMTRTSPAGRLGLTRMDSVPMVVTNLSIFLNQIAEMADFG
jgi:hypothetical protein